MTFAELNRECDAIAHGLKGLGIDRGVRTVMMVPPNKDFFALVFALFKLGAVPVMVDPGMGIANLGKCLHDASPAAMIGIPKALFARWLLGWAKDTIKTCVSVGGRFPGATWLDRIKFRERGVFSTVSTKGDETAAILFTSGSTGVPKGAVYTHGNFDAQVRLLRSMYSIVPGEIDLPTFPLFALFAPALGMTSIIPKMDFSRPAKADPVEIIGAIQDRGCTTMFASPALLANVGRYGVEKNIKLPTLRRVITAGAPVPANTVEQFAKLLRDDAIIVTPYGATESLPVASIDHREILQETRHRTDNGEGVCVGRPAPEMEVRIMKIDDGPIDCWDESLVVPTGQVGEVVVKGPVVTHEYFHRPDQTKLAKVADPVSGGVRHRMGDVGWIDESGRLWFCGRKSHRVVLSDRTLFTDQCEPIFNQHPDVSRTALVGVPINNMMQAVLCVELIHPEHMSHRKRIVDELLQLGARQPHTAGITIFLFHPRFPVDVRHNAKIFREKLALWATRKLT
jgi:acyl-CoA synthetase (AMP-forming)/AMP-acid ligase II